MVEYKLQRVPRNVDLLRFAQRPGDGDPYVRGSGRRRSLLRREYHNSIGQLGRGVRIGVAEVVHRVEREEMVQELFDLVIAAHERRTFVQLAQESRIGEQGSQVAGQELLFQRKPDPGSGVADVGLDVRHRENVSNVEL